MSSLKLKGSKTQKNLVLLENSIGNFLEYWGFKKIHGRIWTHLYTSSQPLDAQTLMTKLKVSKGLMSLALRELLDYDVIKLDHTGKHGTSFYSANTNLFEVVSNVLKSRELKMIQEVQNHLETLIKGIDSDQTKSDLAVDRLQSLNIMTSTSLSLLETFLSQNLPQDQQWGFLNTKSKS